MYRRSSALLTDVSLYDSCLFSNCVKKIFSRQKSSAEEFKYKLEYSVTGVKTALELLNFTNQPELSIPYLQSLEQSMAETGFRYAVVYKENVPVLCCYFQLFTIQSANFNLENNKSFARRIVKFFLDIKKVKILISGNVLRNGTPSYCFDRTQCSDEQATELVASIAEKIASEECATALVLRDLTFTPVTNAWLEKLGYQQPFDDATMVMEVDPGWGNIEGYVAQLTRKYRSRANKILTSGNAVTLKELGLDEIKENTNRISTLFSEVVASQKFRLDRVDAAHFADLKALYGSGFEFWGYFIDGELVAFYTAFITQDAFEIYYVGLDYAANNEHQLYFNILLSGLSRCIQLGKKQLKLGRTSFDAKASLGARPEAANYYLKTSHIPQAVVNWFALYFSSLEDGKWKLRNPFGQTA